MSHRTRIAQCALISACLNVWALAMPGGAAETSDSEGQAVTIDEIADGIRKHIAEQSKVRGGYFKVPFRGKELSLELVRVHLEYLSDLGGGVHFACVDLVGTDGAVYDLDFFMEGPPGRMTVTETSVHKINGQPFYAWEQKKGGISVLLSWDPNLIKFAKKVKESLTQ